jgi:uncharacterized protein YjlB
MRSNPSSKSSSPIAQLETHTFEDAGGIPKSRLPVLLYHDVQGAGEADECEELFARNG